MKKIGLFVVLWTMVLPCFAQDQPDSLATSGPEALRVFLDCDRCDNQYIRTEITFVNYVRDRLESQVHLLITTQRAGSGREFTLTFIGREDFSSVSDTLLFVSSDTDTDDERREGLAQIIKLGLMRYVARTPQAAQLAISYDTQSEQNQMRPEDDPWDFWVFRFSLNGSYEAEESRDRLRLGGSANASRVTDEWKVRFSAFGSYREQNFVIDDERVKSINRNGDLRTLAVKSLGPKWSLGGFTSVSTSSFNNTALAATVSPAIEYNLFPYTEATRREFRLSYFLNFRSFDYEEITTFGKTSDQLLQHSLEASLEIQQPWGNAFASLEGSNYLYDFESGESLVDLYSIELDAFVEMRLVRGLNVFVEAQIEWIQDQISLPAEEASGEDILLRNRRLPTSYEYEFSLGFSYTFGSIFNNIVNPRFGV